MKKVLIFILVCPLLVCCHNQRRHNMVPVIQTDTMDVFRHIFKSRTLQDSLDAFIIDSRKTTFKDTLVFSICLYRSNSTFIRPCTDTMAFFIMDDEVWTVEDPRGQIQPRIIGAIRYGNEILGLSYYDYSPADTIVNECLFDLQLWYKYKKSYGADESVNALKMASMNRYKFEHGDDLILRRKYRNSRFFDKGVWE